MGKKYDTEKMKYMMQVQVLTKRQEKMEQKLRHMKEMLAVAEEHNKKRITVNLISQIYNAPTEDQAQKCIKLIPQEKDEDTDEETGGKGAGGAKLTLVKGAKGKKDGKARHGSGKSSSSSSSSDGEKK